MAKRKKIKIPKPELNITAMMDLVLNLIMFFVLVANFASAQLPKLDPPKPDASAAKAPKGANKIVVSVLAVEKGTAYEFGGVQFVRQAERDERVLTVDDRGRLRERETIEVKLDNLANLGPLVDFVSKEKRSQPNLEVYLRADKRLTYADVQPVMMAIVAGGVAKINVVAKTEEQ